MQPFGAVVISGTLGAGKSTIAEAVSDALVGGAPHALLDLDAFAQAWPAPSDDPFNDELVFANLAAVWPNYVKGGVHRAVIARVVAAGHQQRYVQALGGCRVAVVRLQAPARVRRERITAREIDPVWRDRFLSRTEQLAEELATVPADFAIDNTEPPAAIASQVLSRLGWR